MPQVQAKEALTVAIGAMELTKVTSSIFTIPNVGSSLVIVLFDRNSRAGGVAHTLLPDSQLAAVTEIAAPGEAARLPAKFVDLAVPALWEKFQGIGGAAATTTARLIGGSQLFNFGGGGGNPLNVGSRNAIAARTTLMRLGVNVEKADIGGNKGRNVRFEMSTGDIYVSLIGGREYMI